MNCWSLVKYVVPEKKRNCSQWCQRPKAKTRGLGSMNDTFIDVTGARRTMEMNSYWLLCIDGWWHWLWDMTSLQKDTTYFTQATTHLVINLLGLSFDYNYPQNWFLILACFWTHSVKNTIAMPGSLTVDITTVLLVNMLVITKICTAVGLNHVSPSWSTAVSCSWTYNGSYVQNIFNLRCPLLVRQDQVRSLTNFDVKHLYLCLSKTFRKGTEITCCAVSASCTL